MSAPAPSARSQAARSAAGEAPPLGSPQPVAAGALAAPPEIVAVIAAAVEQVWPRGVGKADANEGGPEYVWRMSGRWWSKPIPLRRDRPWSDHREHGLVDRR